MRLSKAPQFLNRLGDLIRPRDEQEKQFANLAASVMAIAAFVALLLYYLA